MFNKFFLLKIGPFKR